jgi:4-diphosphocytidyl-2-C-methyl-D-erythritol kinase
MALERQSHCKVNLLLNILGKRADGFHELETVMQPIAVHDRIEIARSAGGIELTCSEPTLPTDGRNLVYRAAELFLKSMVVKDGVKLRLEKRIPLAAGLGGGSANAAITLLAMNELFDQPLGQEELAALAAQLGSDVPFFLQPQAALATGRGEKIQPLGSFSALKNCAALLIHPGFGISTAWAYQSLARFPQALNGTPGRAAKLILLLRGTDLVTAGRELYNSLEAPALEKYPLLALFQEFLREQGAAATLMSGSGSTTFGIFRNLTAAEAAGEKVRSRFGDSCWITAVPL